jgi:WD40 repeat protein
LGTATIARVIADSPVSGGVFSPDGSRLAVVGPDDTVALYRAGDLQRLATLTVGTPAPRLPPTLGATPVAFSQDGRTLVVGDRTGAVQVFDARSGRRIGAPISSGLTFGVSGLTFSPDDRILVATSTPDQFSGVRVIDLARRTAEPVTPPFPFALAATFRTDGRQLITTTGVGGAAGYPVVDGKVGRWNLLARLGGTQAETAAFSPDERLLAVGRQNGKVQFYEAKTLQPRRGSVAVSNAIIATMAFSGDGRLLVTQDLGLKFRLVDVAGREPVGESIPNTPTGFGVAGFSPDGHQLALPDAAGTALWDLDLTRWRRGACTLAGRDLTRAEWDRYFGAAGDYRRTCAR